MKMIRKYDSLTGTLLLALLFSALGIFSCLLLVHYTEIAERTPESVTLFGTVVTAVCVFNVFGFSLMQVDNWLSKNDLLFYEKRGRLIVRCLYIALLLLLLNYAIFVFVKWIAGISTPYMIRGGGIRLLLVVWLVEMVVVGLLLVNHSIRNTLKLYREKQQLQDVAVRAQYTALQNQLNPHFLFNSLNTLIAEIQYDPANAVRFTQNLSDVYRYILQRQDRMLVTLREELEFLEAYVFLHQVRLGDCLKICREFPDEWLDRKVPPLTLQLLVENVIKHNYMDENRPLSIRMMAGTDGESLVFTNDLHPKKSVEKTGTGLRNLSERYRLLCGEEIVVKSSETCFTVSIPLLYE